MRKLVCLITALTLCLTFTGLVSPQSDPVADYKSQVVKDVEARSKQTQVMIDMVFSFGRAWVS